LRQCDARKGGENHGR
jgi:hypothetical protein